MFGECTPWRIGQRICVAILALSVGAASWANDNAESGESQIRSSVGEQDTVNKLRNVHDKLQRVTAEAQIDRQAQISRLQEAQAQNKASKKTIAFLQKEIEKQQELRDKKLRENEERAEKIKKLESEAATLAAPIRDYLDKLEATIAAGIPWKRETRLEQVSKSREYITHEDTPPNAALSTVLRIQKEEEALSRLVETSTLEIEQGDEKIAVQGFHLGLLAVIFASDDGSIIGYAGPGESLDDGLETVKQRPTAGEGYLRAVDILKRRRTPALVDLFVPTLSGAKSDRGGE